jgi:hypothetical protein
MSETHRRGQIIAEFIQEGIVIDSTVEKAHSLIGQVARICWNTGEERNCSGCYLSAGCKAK